MVLLNESHEQTGNRVPAGGGGISRTGARGLWLGAVSSLAGRFDYRASLALRGKEGMNKETDRPLIERIFRSLARIVICLVISLVLIAIVFVWWFSWQLDSGRIIPWP